MGKLQVYFIKKKPVCNMPFKTFWSKTWREIANLILEWMSYATDRLCDFSFLRLTNVSTSFN